MNNDIKITCKKTIEKIRASKNKEMFLCPSHKRKFVISINARNLRWPLLFFPGMAKVSCGINWHHPRTNSGISSDIKITVTELYMLSCWNFSHRDLELQKMLSSAADNAVRKRAVVVSEGREKCLWIQPRLSVYIPVEQYCLWND